MSVPYVMCVYKYLHTIWFMCSSVADQTAVTTVSIPRHKTQFQTTGKSYRIRPQHSYDVTLGTGQHFATYFSKGVKATDKLNHSNHTTRYGLTLCISFANIRGCQSRLNPTDTNRLAERGDICWAWLLAKEPESRSWYATWFSGTLLYCIYTTPLVAALHDESKNVRLHHMVEAYQPTCWRKNGVCIGITPMLGSVALSTALELERTNV